ncbi:MAG TPA: lysylphosphatidylglycerol synthase transmembrane domain-containing protein [Bryobacteraceae bacterium]|nr:lysylphosphatidylglycerol synthase transmembrane domain-containing protein [Bryobacteraceae bacterium]
MSQRARGGVWKWVAAVALAAALLYFSLRGVDWPGVWRIIAHARWVYLAAAGVLTCASSTLRALRWRILLNAEADLSIWTVFRATMAGYLGNNFLPARAGEFIRSLLISRRSHLSKTYVLTTALSERLMDVIALVLTSSIVLMGVSPQPAWMGPLARSMAIVAALGVLAVTILPHTGRLVTNLIGKLPLAERWRSKLQALAEQVLLGLRAFHDWGRFGGFLCLTAVIWTSDSFSAVMGARALGLDISFAIAILFITALGLGSALPSTPGYVGIYQFVAVSVLVPFGVSKDGALAYILVFQALAYVVVVLLGLPSFSLMREARTATGQDARLQQELR